MARTNIPTSPNLLKPQVVTDAYEQLQKCKEKQKFFYDRNSKSLPILSDHDVVRIKKDNKWVPATVTGKASTPRSFIVTTSNGQKYRRNRQHIIKTHEDPPIFTGPIPDILETDATAENTSQLLPSPHTEDEEIGTDSTPHARRSSRVRRQPTWFKDYQLT